MNDEKTVVPEREAPEDLSKKLEDSFNEAMKALKGELINIVKDSAEILNTAFDRTNQETLGCLKKLNSDTTSFSAKLNEWKDAISGSVENLREYVDKMESLRAGVHKIEDWTSKNDTTVILKVLKEQAAVLSKATDTWRSILEDGRKTSDVVAKLPGQLKANVDDALLRVEKNLMECIDEKLSQKSIIAGIAPLLDSPDRSLHQAITGLTDRMSKVENVQQEESSKLTRINRLLIFLLSLGIVVSVASLLVSLGFTAWW